MATNCKGRNSGMNTWEQLRKISEEAYVFLKSFEPSQYNDGRIDLGNGMYVNIESYSTKYRKERKFEAHRKYIDVQYMISGRELITVAELGKNLKCIDEYDEQKDIAYYENCLEGIDFFLEERCFLILMPSDAHMPCIAIDKTDNVRKAVIKIPIKVL